MTDHGAIDDLMRRAFSAQEARARGLDPSELRLEDIRQVSKGVFVPGTGIPDIRNLVRAHLDVNPDAWASHRTAAALLELWLPAWLQDHSDVHLSKPSHLPRVRRPGVVGHRVRILDGEVRTVDDVRLTSPGRTWLDLGQELTPAALIALGDQLIRHPRPEFEGRSEPYETKGSLAALLKAHPKVKGVGRCKEALVDMRVGSDSVPETLLRLSLIAHGFPEPELQIALDPTDPKSYTVDVGYRSVRVGIHYEGAHHTDPNQQLSDLRRDSAFRRATWDLIHATAADIADDFLRVRRELRALLTAKAA